MINNRSRILRVMKEMKMKIEVGRISRRRNLRGKSVLISCVTPRRYTRNLGPRFSMLNTGFCVDLATRTTVTMISANSVNRSTLQLAMPMTMINGSDVIHAIDG
jgi:hypothetical protein